MPHWRHLSPKGHMFTLRWEHRGYFKEGIGGILSGVWGHFKGGTWAH